MAANGRIHLFARGMDNALWHGSVSAMTSGDDFVGWQRISGSVTGTPAAVFTSFDGGPKDIFVFVRNSAGGLDEFEMDPTSNAVVGFNPIGGTFWGSPAVVATQANQLDVFVRGTDENIWTNRSINGAWSGFNPIGTGTLYGNPTVTSRGSGDIDVFARGSNNTIYQAISQNNGPYVSWIPIGLHLTSSPSSVAWAGSKIAVAADEGQPFSLGLAKGTFTGSSWVSVPTFLSGGAAPRY